MVNVNVEPFPSADSTHIRPPCNSTIRLAIARPSPVTAFARLLELIYLLEFLEDPLLVSFGNARPGVRDRDNELAVRCRA